MAKKRFYNLQLQTPGGEVSAAANTMPDLVEITPRGLFGDLLSRPETKDENGLDIVARDLWAAFLERQKNQQRVYQSSISKAGCELNLIRCYLQSLSIEETASFLSELSGTKMSHSSVGRYWKELNKIGPDFKARL